MPRAEREGGGESPSTAGAPSIGVLVTYYGERELLRECLESLFAGTDRPDEVLVYDDASPYPAHHYLPAGVPVRVVRGEENRGPSHGRNVLLAACRSDYVHFHDADDLFHPEWCERVRGALVREPLDAVFTEIASVRDGQTLSARVLDLARLEHDPDLLRFCIRGFMLVPSGTYRREFVQAQGGYRTDLWQSEDFDFHVRLAGARPRFRVITEPLVVIRIRRESRSQNRYETWTCAADAVRHLATRIDPAYLPDLAEKAAAAGSALFQLGAVREAREAFALARRLGPPRYQQQNRLYRALARSLGPLVAERVGGAYRALLPSALRGRLTGREG